MDLLSLLPAVYVAALICAIGGDFLRAQLAKDLEHDPPDWIHRLMSSISLPTIFLVGALMLRALVYVKGLLLTALLCAAVLSLWKTLWSFRAHTSATRRPIH